jgi:hypothetical protein
MVCHPIASSGRRMPPMPLTKICPTPSKELSIFDCAPQL